jgi:hypothetical protein
MQPKVDRRKFLSMFAAGSVGMSVVDKVDLLADMSKWVLSPSKTIFIPPPLSEIRFDYFETPVYGKWEAWQQIQCVSMMFYAK